MKRIKRWIGMLFILTGILFIGVFLIAIVNQDTSPLSNINKYEKVKRYDVLRAELRKYQLEEYTHVLLALMYQESRGEGGDPMQALESAGLPPNTIDDPKRSIQQGIRHFNDVPTYGKEKNVDFPTIIQAYNSPTPPPLSLRLRRNSKGIRARELQNFNLMTIEFSPSIHEI
ncbi:lysozyme family protein [Aneurinibacillus aneurinilyticus]|uniref:lysozyme family protein n=1 Tax=Aneurinibacillus aneurinilyticus TaxID=1391 RepID=UPI0023EFDDEF|nr:lysozyme family protein [Aneurinibacillus aneurinilyticus]